MAAQPPPHQQKKERDVVDVHVTGESSTSNSILQYPLLDGTRIYTAEITEFVCPLTHQSPLPSDKFFEHDTGMFFRIRRKNVGNPPLTDHTLMPGNMAAPVGGVGGNMTTDKSTFRKNPQRTIRTVGDVSYYGQRFFDDVKAAYFNPGNPGVGLLLGAEHGGGPDAIITANTSFVDVRLQPNGCLTFFFSPLWTKHFWLEVSAYGQKILGLPDSIIAFATVGGATVTGQAALIEPAGGVAGAGLNIQAGEINQTVELVSLYPIDRFFEHRVRVEVRSDMGIPPTVVWDVDDKESYSFVMATFPITTTTTTGVLCNNLGTTTDNVTFTNSLLSGNINFRKAEDRVTERYRILNSQYFHSIRLQLYIVRKEWNTTTKEFAFKPEKLEFAEGQSWTAKIRFRSV